MLADSPVGINERDIDRLIRLGAASADNTEHLGKLGVLFDQLRAFTVIV
jgi:hypothetical protein